MKKVFLITEDLLGENLSELLSIKGYDSFIVRQWSSVFTRETAEGSDLFICDEEYLNNQHVQHLSKVIGQRPCVVLCSDKSSPMRSIEGGTYLNMPFSDREFFEAVARSLAA